mgnify:CR=1 FL=1
MANSDNLKSLANRTKNEQREITKKGGIASGKARREKKRREAEIKASGKNKRAKTELVAAPFFCGKN